MRGERGDDRGKSQFHKDLQCQKTAESVVIALDTWIKKMQNQHRSYRPGKSLNKLCGKSGKYRIIREKYFQQEIFTGTLDQMSVFSEKISSHS